MRFEIREHPSADLGLVSAKAMTGTRADAQLDVERLRTFLQAFRTARNGGDLENRLRRFILHAAPMLRGLKQVVAPQKRELAPDRLTELTETLRGPLAKARADGVYVNVWKIAGLGRNEVRIAAVLAWLLSPGETHGCGDALMRALFGRATAQNPTWSLKGVDFSKATVRTELRPQASERDRVDIAIEGSHFIVFVEAKIDAPEGRDQLKRYAESARAIGKAAWRIIYLSPTRPELLPENTVHLTWRHMRSCIREMGRSSSRGFTSEILKQFTHHLRAIG